MGGSARFCSVSTGTLRDGRASTSARRGQPHGNRTHPRDLTAPPSSYTMPAARTTWSTTPSARLADIVACGWRVPPGATRLDVACECAEKQRAVERKRRKADAKREQDIVTLGLKGITAAQHPPVVRGDRAARCTTLRAPAL